jgi:uncharacterized membrane protein
MPATIFAVLLTSVVLLQEQDRRIDLLSNPAQAPSKPDFEKHILPLLKERCSKCHGEERRIANLSLISAAELKKGGLSGPVIVPKQPEKSSLFNRIKSKQMPPQGEGQLFNEDELKIVEQWIRTGARMQDRN